MNVHYFFLTSKTLETDLTLENVKTTWMFIYLKYYLCGIALILITHFIKSDMSRVTTHILSKRNDNI